MPRSCSICQHPDRQAIHQALGAGEALRTIATRWSVSKTALLRHRDMHLPPAPGMPQRPQENTTSPVLAPEAARTLQQYRILAVECERLRTQDWRKSASSPSVVYDPLVRQLDGLRRRCRELGINPDTME